MSARGEGKAGERETMVAIRQANFLIANAGLEIALSALELAM